MTTTATIYKVTIEHLASPIHSRIDCFVKFNDGQMAAISETGRTTALSKKFKFDIVSPDLDRYAGRKCAVIRDDRTGTRFASFLDT